MAFEPYHVKGTCKPFIPNSTKNKAVTRQGSFLKRIFQAWAISIRFSVAPSGQAYSNVFVIKSTINSLLSSFVGTMETHFHFENTLLLSGWFDLLAYSLMFLNTFIFVKGQFVKFRKLHQMVHFHLLVLRCNLFESWGSTVFDCSSSNKAIIQLSSIAFRRLLY